MSRTLIFRSLIMALDQPANSLQKVALIETAFDDVRAGAGIDAALALLARLQCRDQDDGQIA